MFNSSKPYLKEPTGKFLTYLRMVNALLLQTEFNPYFRFIPVYFNKLSSKSRNKSVNIN